MREEEENWSSQWEVAKFIACSLLLPRIDVAMYHTCLGHAKDKTSVLNIPWLVGCGSVGDAVLVQGRLLTFPYKSMTCWQCVVGNSFLLQLPSQLDSAIIAMLHTTKETKVVPAPAMSLAV